MKRKYMYFLLHTLIGAVPLCCVGGAVMALMLSISIWQSVLFFFFTGLLIASVSATKNFFVFIKPINEIMNCISHDTNNLTKRISTKYKGDIGAFAREFNNFITNLHVNIAKVGQINNTLVESSQRLDGVSRIWAERNQQLAATATDMSLMYRKKCINSIKWRLQ